MLRIKTSQQPSQDDDKFDTESVEITKNFGQNDVNEDNENLSDDSENGGNCPSPTKIRQSVL